MKRKYHVVALCRYTYEKYTLGSFYTKHGAIKAIKKLPPSGMFHYYVAKDSCTLENTYYFQ